MPQSKTSERKKYLAGLFCYENNLRTV